MGQENPPAHCQHHQGETEGEEESKGQEGQRSVGFLLSFFFCRNGWRLKFVINFQLMHVWGMNFNNVMKNLMQI